MAAAISSFIRQTSVDTLAASAFCGTLAVECAVLSAMAIGAKVFGKIEKKDEAHAMKVSVHALGSSLFFAMASANLIPGSAKVSAAVFLLIRNKWSDLEDSYVSQSIDLIHKKLIDPVIDKIIVLFKSSFEEDPVPRWRYPSLNFCGGMALAIGIYRYASPFIANIAKSKFNGYFG